MCIMTVSRTTPLFVFLLVFVYDTGAQITDTDVPHGKSLSGESSENITHIDGDKLNGHLEPETLELIQAGYEQSTEENDKEAATYPTEALEKLEDFDSTSSDNQESTDSLSISSLSLFDEISSDEEVASKGQTDGLEPNNVINDSATSGNFAEEEDALKIGLTQSVSVSESSSFVNDAQQRGDALDKDDESSSTDSTDTENLFSGSDDEDDESLFESFDILEFQDITTALYDVNSNSDVYKQIEEILRNKSSHDIEASETDDRQTISFTNQSTNPALVAVDTNEEENGIKIHISTTSNTEEETEDKNSEANNSVGIQENTKSGEQDTGLDELTAEQPIVYSTEAVSGEANKPSGLSNEEESFSESKVQEGISLENTDLIYTTDSVIIPDRESTTLVVDNLQKSDESENISYNSNSDISHKEDDPSVGSAIEENTSTRDEEAWSSKLDDTNEPLANERESFNESQTKEDISLVPNLKTELVESSDELTTQQYIAIYNKEATITFEDEDSINESTEFSISQEKDGSENVFNNPDGKISHIVKSNKDEDFVGSAIQDNIYIEQGTGPIELTTEQSVVYTSTVKSDPDVSDDTSQLLSWSNEEENLNGSDAQGDVSLLSNLETELIESSDKPTTQQSVTTHNEETVNATEQEDSTKYSIDNLQENGKNANISNNYDSSNPEQVTTDKYAIYETLFEESSEESVLYASTTEIFDNSDSEISQRLKNNEHEDPIETVIQKNMSTEQETGEFTTVVYTSTAKFNQAALEDNSKPPRHNWSNEEESLKESDAQYDISLVPNSEAESVETSDKSTTQQPTINYNTEITATAEQKGTPMNSTSFSISNLQENDDSENISNNFESRISEQLTSDESASETYDSMFESSSTEQSVPYRLITDISRQELSKFFGFSNEEETSTEPQAKQDIEIPTTTPQYVINKIPTAIYEQNNSEQITEKVDSEDEENNISTELKSDESFPKTSEKESDNSEPLKDISIKNKELTLSPTIQQPETKILDKDADNYEYNSLNSVSMEGSLGMSSQYSEEVEENVKVSENSAMLDKSNNTQYDTSTIESDEFATSSENNLSSYAKAELESVSTESFNDSETDKSTSTEPVDNKDDEYVTSTSTLIVESRGNTTTTPESVEITEATSFPVDLENTFTYKETHNISEFIEIKKTKVKDIMIRPNDKDESTEESVSEVDEKKEVRFSINREITGDKSLTNNTQNVTKSTKTPLIIYLLHQNVQTDITTEKDPAAPKTVLKYTLNSNIAPFSAESFYEDSNSRITEFETKEIATTEKYLLDKITSNTSDISGNFSKSQEKNTSTDYQKTEDEIFPRRVSEDPTTTDMEAEKYNLELPLTFSSDKDGNVSIHNFFNSLDTFFSKILSSSVKKQDQFTQDNESNEYEENTKQFDYFEATTAAWSGKDMEKTTRNTDLHENDVLRRLEQDFTKYIDMKVFGSHTNMSIKVEIEGTIFYVPSTAYFLDDLERLTLNITWRSFDKYQNNSLYLMLTETPERYLLKAVQLFLVRGNIIEVWEKNLEANDTFGKAQRVVEFEDDVKVTISGLEFLRRDQEDREVKTDDIKPMLSEISIGKTSIYICTGCTVVVLLIFATLYVVIKKSRRGTLKIVDVAKCDIPV